jgi:flagellar biosynthesis/type III secretory pathway protein FliH
LRLLGRDRVQAQALDELGRLPNEHPLRRETTVRVLRWRAEALQQARPTEADRELIMNSARLVTQWENRLRREGKAEGKAEGLREGEARGKAEGLRRAVEALCGVLGIALPPARQARLAAMGVDELEALCQALQQQRRWPRRGER